jgi:hypothetical protein
MECAELEKLRGQVREIRKEMTARRERARGRAEQNPQAARDDGYQALLERKLAHTVADIEQHVAQHKCQE